tara:strand:- start:3473 stop:3931 length:459 start_codon:yes stop_codon:yes gene_type:complete
MIFLGIDPGKNGGIVFLKDNFKNVAYKCPDTIEGMVSLIKKETKGYRIKIAMIEKVHSMPRDGVVSAFSFGRNFGSWLGVLEALNIKVNMVTPQKWQKYYGKLPKEKKSKKHKLKSIASNLYPGVKCTLATSDAILIGHYGKNIGLQGPSLA